jgi:hypothetical protein
MNNDRMQAQRFELKYVIPEPTARAVSQFVSSYLLLDPYGARQENRSYPVHSLYLDSDDLALHHSTINGNKNRYKLRLRFYENRPEAPVYFEIKRRMNNTISKERSAVRREAVGRVLAGHLPAAGDLTSADPRQLAAAQHFVRHLNELRAKPRVHVSYLREAWLPFDGGNSIRVTLDRCVRSCPETTARLSPEMDDPVSVFGEQVVLELKYTSRFPFWFGELVRALNLRQTSAAKYVDGILLMAENRLMPPATRFQPVSEQRQRRRTTVVSSPSHQFFKYISEGAL